jgi:hypothetical protein
MHASKAQINSVVMGMQHQLATMRMAGSMQKSTEVMKSMQQLVKVSLRAFCLMEDFFVGSRNYANHARNVTRNDESWNY